MSKTRSLLSLWAAAVFAAVATFADLRAEEMTPVQPREARATPWDVSALSKPPKVYPATERPAKGMRSLFNEGA